MPEDRPIRNKCPQSTFPVRSVAQLPTLARRQQMEVSCSTWGRSTEVRCCLQTLWDNCAGSSVALSDRNGCRRVQLLRKRYSFPRTSRGGHIPGQTTARAPGRCGRQSTTPSEFATSSSRRTSGRQPGTELPYSGCLSDRNETSSCSPSFAGPQR